MTGAPVVVTSLTDGAAVRSVLLDRGALAAMEPGSTVVDLSTIDVESSRAVAEAAQARRVRYVRGAVSGTPAAVSAGNASLLLSGPRDALDAARDVLADVTAKQTVVGAAEEARAVKKDLDLAVSLRAAHGAPMPVTAQIQDQFRMAQDAGYGADDILSVFRIQQANANLPVDPLTAGA